MFNSIKLVKKNKIYYLDGLRGLAAIAVLIWHFIAVFYPAAANGNSEISHSFFYGDDYFPFSIFFFL